MEPTATSSAAYAPATENNKQIPAIHPNAFRIVFVPPVLELIKNGESKYLNAIVASMKNPDA